MRTARAAGFTVVELLIATAILMTVIGAVFAVMHPSRGAFATQLEAADVQQRLRVAAEAVVHDVQAAGAGPVIGPSAGPLIDALPPLMPHRLGRRGGEAGVFRSDAISVLSILPSAAQGTLRIPGGGDRIARTQRTLALDPLPHCPPDVPLCGFSAGTRALLFDRHGAWDLVTVTQVDGDVLEIAYDGTLSAAYAAGATLAEVSARTFYLHTDAGAQTFQLRRYDGFDSDLPLVDDIVALDIQYFGDPEPPRLLGGSAADLPDGPRTTYGPPPPPLGHDNPDDSWGAGESCLFAVVAGEHAPRLPPLAGAAGGLVALDAAALTDGPWCPDDTAPHRVDADLFRVRLVRITVRVQAAPAALRGPAGLLFLRGGTARSATRMVADLEVQIDVAPRNLVSR